MTSKERAALRAQANTIETTLIVGKGGVSEQVLQEASNLLDAHELIKGKVLETAMLTAREASDAVCEALGAEGIGCVGTKFIVWRKSEKLDQGKRRRRSPPQPSQRRSGTATIIRSRCRTRAGRSSSASGSRSRRNISTRPPSRPPSREENSSRRMAEGILRPHSFLSLFGERKEPCRTAKKRKRRPENLSDGSLDSPSTRALLWTCGVGKSQFLPYPKVTAFPPSSRSRAAL